MAKANERTEREFQLDINQAVANTEGEIFADATGDEPLENDADTSLEQMGEGLEGDDLEEEDEADEEGETEGEAPEGEEGDASEEDEEAETAEANNAQGQPRDDQRGRPEGRPHVPLREERERRRAAEDRATLLERQLAEMGGRVNELSARVNAAPKPEKTVEETKKPDMFADPEGYERWLMAEAERKAEAKLEQRFGAFEQRQQQERATRLNENLELTASGERGFEFQAAYRTLTTLPRNAQSAAIVQRLVNSPDPGKAILDWFEDNGADNFRESIAKQLGLVPPPRDERRGPGRTGSRQPSQQQPRREYRVPPSLNSAQGGQRQQATDPEMMNDTDESVFSFATRR